MDNFSDINLKGGSKIKVGDSLTISDSGVLGSDNKPKYLEVKYLDGVPVVMESNVCIGHDFEVTGRAMFNGEVLLGDTPTVSGCVIPVSDNQLATKKYVDDKVGEGSSGSLPSDPSFNSIKVGGAPGCEPIAITSSGSIAVMQSNQVVFVDASNGGASYKLPQKQCASIPYTLATLEDLNTSSCSSSGCIYILCTSDKNLCNSINLI